MIYARFEVGRMQELKYKSCKDFLSRGWSRYEILSIQGLKPVRKIVYAKV